MTYKREIKLLSSVQEENEGIAQMGGKENKKVAHWGVC